MDDVTQAFDWKGSLAETYNEFVQQAINYLPQLLGAFALLLVGWFLAVLLRILTRKLIRGLDTIFFRVAQKRGLEEIQVKSFARLASNIVFWVVLLFFLAASANLLDWQIFSNVTEGLLTYLPNLVTGFLIILAGFAVSGVTRSAVASAAETADLGQAGLLAKIAQITVIIAAIVIGVEQLGVNVDFLTMTLIVIVGTLLGGIALAFGLGAKHFVANVIGAQTARKHYQPGQLIQVGGTEGHLLEITTTTIVLDTTRGRAALPAKLFHERVSEVLTS